MTTLAALQSLIAQSESATLKLKRSTAALEGAADWKHLERRYWAPRFRTERGLVLQWGRGL